MGKKIQKVNKKMNSKQFKVATFYKYIELNNLNELTEKIKEKCSEIKLMGTILLAEEGINGNIAGTREQLNEFKEFLESIPEFKEMVYRENFSECIPFKKASVRKRNEIVTLGLKEVNVKHRGRHISPQELKKMIQEKQEIVLLDARSNYETKIGKFKNAVTLNIENFREFPKKLNELNKFKEKKIVMYCTGGVKCEKASAYLKEKGFKNVFQLNGGIINYINQFPDSELEGRCFVFDKRLSVPSGKKDSLISSCKICHKETAQYINCSNTKCDELFICCNECKEKFLETCSKKCRKELEKQETIKAKKEKIQMNKANLEKIELKKVKLKKIEMDVKAV